MMPQKDTIHDAVRAALENDGWTVTDDPFLIRFEDVKFYADIKAEKKAESDSEKQCIVIEVKSFLHRSPVHNLEEAVGQYRVYKQVLEEVAPEIEIYLAIGHEVYQQTFQKRAFQAIIRGQEIKMLVVDTVRRKIVTWINTPNIAP